MPTTVDSSIYGDLKQPDPLGVAKSVNEYQAGVSQNRLLQMQVTGREQLGKAVQEATDANGVVDQAKLSEILKRPENWAAASEGAKFGVDLRGGQLSNEKSGIDVSQAGFQNLGTVWGARAARTEGDLDPKQLRQDVYDLWARGGLGTDAKRVLELIRQIPDDPKATRAFATGGFLQAVGAGGMAAPAEATPGPGGETRKQTGAEFVTKSLGGGEPAASPPAAAVVPDRGVRTSPTLAEAQALPRVGLSAADASARLSASAGEVPTRKGMLDNMLADAAQFTAGPASEELKTTISGVNELFGTKFDVERVAAQERFDKLANQIALAQSDALGITDLTTQTAMGANPHSRLSNLGIEGVIAQLKGNEDAIAAKNEAWQDAIDAKQYTLDQYYKFTKDFNKNFDPRVFQAVYLPKAARTKMVSTLSQVELAAFKRKYLFAVEHHWIPDLAEAP